MDELTFTDDWMEIEPFHTHAIDAASQIIVEHCGGDVEKTESVGNMLYHFTSCWYGMILEGRGALVQPAVRACALFTAHMVDCHGMPATAQFGCVAMLTRFTALVITKSGGRLL